MALDTYANLKTAITNHLDRDDLASLVDDFIDVAEAMHKREIRIREMLARDSLTVDARYVSLPAGFLEAQTIRLLTNPITLLSYVDQHEMDRWRQESTGKPSRFTIHEQIEFDITPDSSYSGEIIYFGELTALSDAAPTNALLTRAPDAYLYGALLASAPFLMNDERIDVWGGLYTNARDALNAQARASRKVGPLVSRVSGAIA